MIEIQLEEDFFNEIYHITKEKDIEKQIMRYTKQIIELTHHRNSLIDSQEKISFFHLKLWNEGLNKKFLLKALEFDADSNIVIKLFKKDEKEGKKVEEKEVNYLKLLLQEKIIDIIQK